MLSVAKAMSQWADVTLAFRSIRAPISSDKFKLIAIEAETADSPETKDDVAARGLNVFAHMSYLRKLSRFSKRSAGSYDLVLEKGWRLSGFLSSVFRRQGVPVALIENDVHHWSERVASARAVARYGAHRAAQCVAGYYSRRIPLIIVETDELKSILVRERGVSPACIEVVGLGVDHEIFRPLDQATSRVRLGIRPGAFVLLYVGGMDTYHDMSPVIEALAQVQVPSLELHLVGDGELRGAYEAKAKSALVPIRFHGQVPHEKVPKFVAAADLCIAPYRVSAFANEAVCFSTLKIPEYMACGRPVVSVPSGHIKKLIADQVSGFLFSNDASSWGAFLKNLPSAETLKEMGRGAQRAAASITWDKTAQRYLEACQRLTTLG
jgi:glycosyltransferase involved in cell wall biosynthesis